ncbi:MAG: hypothetical protein LBS89_07835 [Zoogloeaceae bacterium]|jgi:3',5'-cyclic AMP phosphodiesterase CpdA|nr:hypothetical protein [Zoogloeaceae bacterium]
MTTEIYNTWGEFHAAFDRILAQARQRVCIFDGDLAQLGLGHPARIAELQRLLTNPPLAATAPTLRIALKQTDHLHREHPRLVALLKHYGHLLAVQQVSDSLRSLRDTLVIADDAHTLVRFDLEHPRSKIIVEDVEETQPYLQRFEEIWADGGALFSPTILGL